MQIQIHSDDFALSEGLRDHIVRRLAYSLNHSRSLISRVVVRLADINGPKGGIDKCCGIEVRLKGQPTISIDDTQADLCVAIDRATERTGRTLYRRMTQRPQAASRRDAYFNLEAPS